MPRVRFERTTSASSGRRYYQLSYRGVKVYLWAGQVMYDYDRHSKRAWADPRTRINGGDPDRFLKELAREAAQVSQELKTEFVGLNDLGMRLKTERDEKALVYWSERIVKGAKVILANSKRSHELWEKLVKADVTFVEPRRP